MNLNFNMIAWINMLATNVPHTPEEPKEVNGML
jgi:hypothetical protein